MMSEFVSVFFIIAGTFFMVTATIGLVRMPDLYTRMHAMTKGVTLGMVGLLCAAVLELQSVDITIKAILAVGFNFLTNPVGAHMISRAAYHHLKVKFWEHTIKKEWEETIHDWNSSE